MEKNLTKKPKTPLHDKNQRTLLTVVLICLIFSMTYKFYSFKSQVVETNSPPTKNFWSEVAYNNISETYVDVANIKKIDNNQVDFWGKQVFTSDYYVDDKVNEGLLLKFDDALDTIVTHYIVDCTNQTYQFENMLFTLKNGKVRVMKRNDDTLPKQIIPSSLMSFTTDYACQLKDMTPSERLDEMSIEDPSALIDYLGVED